MHLTLTPLRSKLYTNTSWAICAYHVAIACLLIELLWWSMWSPAAAVACIAELWFIWFAGCIKLMKGSGYWTESRFNSPLHYWTESHVNHHEPLISEVYMESEVLRSYRLDYFKTTAFKFIMVRECDYNLAW